MKLITLSDNAKSFSQTLKNEYTNSIDIENSSFSEKYENSELSKYNSSSQNIRFFDNILMNKYYDKIKNSCSSRYLSKEDNFKYQYRPEALSSDVYGTTDLWYLILKVNSCEDFSEFHNLDYVLLPDLNVISECIMNEEFILKKESK